jgi:hypothetical protein
LAKIDERTGVVCSARSGRVRILSPQSERQAAYREMSRNQKADEQSLRLADRMYAKCLSLDVAIAIAKLSNESTLMRVDTIRRFINSQTNKLEQLL